MEMPSKKSKTSERTKADRRKKYKEGLQLLEKAFNSLKLKLDAKQALNPQDLRFLDNYPEIRKKYEMLIADSLEEEKGLPEGKLREFIDRFEWMISIGEHEEVIEASGYYRCDKCGELHTKSRECMYEEHKEMVEDNGPESIEEAEKELENIKEYAKVNDS